MAARSIGWSLLLVGLVLALPSWGATVEVFLRDENGRPIPQQDIGLRVRVEGIRPLRGRTDDAGRLVFSEVPPGQMHVQFLGPHTGNLVAPADNPYAGPMEITVLRADEQLSLVLERLRGKAVRNRLDLPGPDYEKFQISLTHRQTGKVLLYPFGRTDTHQRNLPPGDWQVTVVPPPGYLLMGLEVDGTALPGATAELDLFNSSPLVEVVWTYAAPCQLYGKVLAKEIVVAEVEATLVEGGFWLAAARRRGGSVYEKIRVPVHPQTGAWEMKLPNGQWLVRPIGEAISESQPAETLVQLSDGETRRLDFVVQLRQGQEREEHPLLVGVVDAQNRAVEGAVVQVFSLAEDGKLLAEDRSPASTKSFSGLPAGDLMIAAGHLDHLEGHVILEDFDPRKPPAETRISMPTGSQLAFELIDRKIPAGLSVLVARASPEPGVAPLPDGDFRFLRDPQLAAAKRRRTLVLDQSGRGRMQGLAPGHYQLSAQQLGTASAFVALRDPHQDRWQTELKLALRRSEDLLIQLRGIPASRLRLDPVCQDHWPLPPSFAARVLPAGAALPADPTGGEGPSGPFAFSVDQLAPIGKLRQLELGPLADGDYRLAIRPAGFARWTWGGATHDAAAALVYPIRLAEHRESGRVDLGGFAFECGPALDLLPLTATGQKFPALNEVRCQARVLDRDKPSEAAPEPEVLIQMPPGQAPRFELRKLEPGDRRLVVELEHPHFLPEPVLRWEIPVTLRLGSYRELTLEVEALGGALQAFHPTGQLLIATNSEGVEKSIAFRDGQALLPSLTPALYDVRIEDERGVQARWQKLEIFPSQTRRLDLP